MKLQEDKSGRYNITVPKSMVEARGWEKGQNLEWKVNDDGDLKLVEE